MGKFTSRGVNMFIYTNPNPTEKRTGDCVIRAISIITDKSWEFTYMELCKEGLLMADLPNENAVWASYLKGLGYKKAIIPNTCPECYTAKDFCIDHPKGKYVLSTGSHVIAIIDGNIYDAWDSSNEIPLYYFYKER